jgi:hypothetical protein
MPLSADEIVRIAQNIRAALLAWPASSWAIGAPPPYWGRPFVPINSVTIAGGNYPEMKPVEGMAL